MSTKIQTKTVSKVDGWVEVTSIDVNMYQNKGTVDLYIASSDIEPTSTNEAFKLEPGKEGSYTSTGDSLWVRSFDSEKCGFAYQEV